MEFKTITALILLTILAQIEAQLRRGLSCDERRLVMDIHNDLRRRIARGQVPGQPKAANMQILAWDEELAALAQSWADRGNFVHNKNRAHSQFSVGENLYTTWTNVRHWPPNWRAAIASWEDEYAIYRFSPLFPDHATGHYTQMVWADTRYVGCGFRSITWYGGTNSLYVCNYGPSGNYQGQYAYRVGYGCENLCCLSRDQCSRPYGYWC